MPVMPALAHIPNQQNFLEQCHLRQYPARAAIIHAGDASDSLFFIVKGSVSVVIEDDEGREMVVAINKWDTVSDKPAYLKAINEILEKTLPQLKCVEVVPISAETGFQIPKLLKTCFHLYELWNKEIGTGALNRWLESALEIHAPPLVRSRRIKIRYMTQKSARPPSFILFSNTSEIPDSYIRYLTNSLRESFKLPSVPIRIKIKKNKNPYAEVLD